MADLADCTWKPYFNRGILSKTAKCNPSDNIVFEPTNYPLKQTDKRRKVRVPATKDEKQRKQDAPDGRNKIHRCGL